MLLYACVLAVFCSSALGQTQDFVAELQQRGDFSIFLDLVNTAGLTQTIRDANQMTLFAPTDSSLANLPPGTIEGLKQNPTALRNAVMYYFVDSESLQLRRNNVQDYVLTAANSDPIRINYYKAVHSYTAEGKNITEANVAVNNGYVHVLDGPMFPPEGHVIDLVLARPELSQFAQLAASAGVANFVINDQNMTVFAPTNTAFNKVDPPVMAYLQSHPKALEEVIMYHFVSDLTLYSIGMVHSMTVHSADDHRDNLMLLEDTFGHLFVNHARIIDTDLIATNGVMHTIDEVLIPYRVMVEIQDQGIVIG